MSGFEGKTGKNVFLKNYPLGEILKVRNHKLQA